MWIISTLSNLIDNFYVAMVVRIVLACLLGGIIGYEREHVHRPAGFRTHILVCVGAALVMITSEYIFFRYSPSVNVDPARLGAQVISGIGFLGAGTIIKEGVSVKGLTTAASLWAVSCVGIAVGIGFYSGAFITTTAIFLTLIVLKKTQVSAQKNIRLYVHTDVKKGEVAAVTEMIETMGARIRRTEFLTSEREGETVLRFTMDIPNQISMAQLMENIMCRETVRKVYED